MAAQRFGNYNVLRAAGVSGDLGAVIFLVVIEFPVALGLIAENAYEFKALCGADGVVGVGAVGSIENGVADA